MKQCFKCKETKPKTEFGICARNKDGLKGYCKDCNNAASRRSYARSNGAKISYSPLRPADKDNTRWCSTCKVFLPIDLFGYDAMRAGGLALNCKKCNVNASSTTRVQRKDNSEAQYNHTNNMHSLRQRFNMTETDFQDLMNAQVGCCAVCKTDFGTMDMRACVDHDHATGKVRGLLCHSCNRAIGLLKDRADLLTAASSYLQEAI